MAKASMKELRVVASCPEVYHDAVQEICQKMTIVKAFGQKGDVVDDIPGDWVHKWRMRVVQAVTTSLQLHPACSTARIYCIEGGKHCDAEMAAVPELKRAIQKEMAQMNRTVRTPLSWLSFQEFEEEISEMAKEATLSTSYASTFAREAPKPAEAAAARPIQMPEAPSPTKQERSGYGGLKPDEKSQVALHPSWPNSAPSTSAGATCTLPLRQRFGDLPMPPPEMETVERVEHCIVLEDPEENLPNEADENAKDAEAAKKYEDGVENRAICQAAEAGDVAAVRHFIRADSGAVHGRKYGRTAMHYAAEKGHVEVLSVLAAVGGGVEEADFGFSQTPLHLAAYNGHAAAVADLLYLGAAVVPKDRFGNTPLHDAAENGHMEAAKLLVAARAPLDAKNYKGRTPLDLAKGKGKTDVVKLLEAAQG